ncbi:class I SAM-dependent methyltransferase family protein [Methanosphaera sp. ISO3-F5]|uniref:class I SAM-dependent methyltransferase n=1 Tax=Methanosphaera sp. ISO3-F5 TaxID=1452353 RepID=UPI002B260FC4|nr:class I SAM-dependent methyltransferase family protein [Methanosphaera sp. ISO3-F5]WQH65186.1 class I SAM-dependent methyltransferase family protein [Methanosphaera sp. ISO3-F5]
MKGKIIGDILVVKKEPEDIDEIIKLPYINNIVKLGTIHGQKREPTVEMIYGNSTETVHKENYCKFKIDVAKVMWSKGNTGERLRMSKLPENDEVIVDMFAGIGYFTIPMAVHSKPKKIFAIEINPVSYNFLCENVKLNHVEDIVEPILGDCGEQDFNHVADRIMMGYIGGTHHYLDSAMQYIKEGGIIHYHESTPEPILFERPVNRVREAAEKVGRTIEVLNKRSIKKYSPGVYHTVVDIKIN